MNVTTPPPGHNPVGRGFKAVVVVGAVFGLLATVAGGIAAQRVDSASKADVDRVEALIQRLDKDAEVREADLIERSRLATDQRARAEALTSCALSMLAKVSGSLLIFTQADPCDGLVVGAASAPAVTTTTSPPARRSAFTPRTTTTTTRPSSTTRPPSTTTTTRPPTTTTTSCLLYDPMLGCLNIPADG